MGHGFHGYVGIPDGFNWSMAIHPIMGTQTSWESPNMLGRRRFLIHENLQKKKIEPSNDQSERLLFFLINLLSMARTDPGAIVLTGLAIRRTDKHSTYV